MAFARNELGGINLVSQTRRFEGFISEIFLRVITLLGEKLLFSAPLGNQISQILKLYVYIDVVLLALVNFSERFKLGLYLSLKYGYEVL